MTHNFKRFKRGITLSPTDSGPNPGTEPAEGIEGSMWVYANKIKSYIQASVREILTADQIQTITNKTIVAASNTITTAASGNLVATELNAALSELQTDIDTRALDSDLTAHTGDAVDAHDASAISFDNTASGLTATEVQAAIDEVEGRVDTAESDLTTHEADTSTHGVTEIIGASEAQTLTTKTIVVASNTVTTAASGNLVATELNTALAELQTDIDTRLAGSELTTHESDTSTHGVTTIVGISESQTLTNKTIVAASNTITTTASGTLAATELNAALAELESEKQADMSGTTNEITLTGATIGLSDNPIIPGTDSMVVPVGTTAQQVSTTAGALRYNSDDGTFEGYTDSWGAIGGAGGGSLDFFYTENFESTVAADLTVTGTWTKADNTTTQISGDSSIKMTQASGSSGAQVTAGNILLDLNQKATTISLQGRYLYDGESSEIDFVIYDVTNSAVLSRLSLPASSDVKTFRLLANTISTTANIKWYFEVATENIGAILEFDNIEGRVNPLATVESVESVLVESEGNGGRYSPQIQQI